METCVMIPISTNRTLEPFFLFVFSLLFERMPTRIFIDIWFTMATHIWIGLFAVIVATSKSHIFKNLNLRKKADRNFCGTFLKNRYIQIPQADWPRVIVIWAPFERQRIEVQIFERANLSGFGTWKFTATWKI